MDEEPQAYCGIATVEEPFSLSREGISFRGKTALKIGADIGRENTFQIAFVLNDAWRKGFSEGQTAMRKMINNMNKYEQSTKILPD